MLRAETLTVTPEILRLVAEIDEFKVTIREAETLKGANRNTLKQHLRALLGKSLVKLEGRGRGAWYRLP